MATALSRPELISLAAGFTDHVTLPVSEARKAFLRIFKSPASGQAALQYGTTNGYLRLRELTASQLSQLDETGRAAAYIPEEIVLTNGSQQLLYMVTEALCDPGDFVLVEDPTYFVYLGILQSHGLTARGIRMQSDGVDLAHLEKVLQQLADSGGIARLKLLYVVSYYQNPSGVTTSFAKKQEILLLLRRFERKAGHPIYLLEDAAYRELRFSGDAVLSALMAEHGRDRVLYTGTYSKPFATGVRVGFGVLPEPVLTAVLRIKGNHDFGSSNLLQHLLAETIASGAYAEHLSALQKRYAHKAKVMFEVMQKELPSEVNYSRAAGGLYHWARVPERLATGMDSKLFAAALRNKVLYVPGELCYAKDPTRPVPNHEMRLSFGAESDSNLREGIRRLGKALHIMRRTTIRPVPGASELSAELGG